MRTLTPFADAAVHDLLKVLSDRASSHSAYQDAMRSLGRQLADQITAKLPGDSSPLVFVACTVEDADFLARGVIEELAVRGVAEDSLRLACFWNERAKTFNGSAERVLDVSPVRKQYREEGDVRDAVVVVVKSVISGACVVKTNLAALLNDVTPRHVYVAAPVMFEGAEERLSREFPTTISERFEYITFAVDTERDEEENLVPGIGGSVYERLGFDDKNAHVPAIVRERRRSRAPSGNAI